MLNAARGVRFNNATLVVYKPGTTETQVRYSFTNLLISAHSSNDLGRSNGFPIESLSLSFARITVEVGSSRTCFDRTTGGSC